MSLMQRGFTRLFAAGQTIDLQSPDDYRATTSKTSLYWSIVWSRVQMFASVSLIHSRSVSRKVTEPHSSKPPTPNRKATVVFRTFRVQVRPHGLRDAGTATLQLQQSLTAPVPPARGFGNTIGLDLDLVIPNPGFVT